MTPEFKWKPLQVSAPVNGAESVDTIYVPVYSGAVEIVAASLRLRKEPWADDLFTQAGASGFDASLGSKQFYVGGGICVCLFGLGKRPEDSHSARQSMHIAGLCVRHAVEHRARSIRIIRHASSADRAAAMLRSMTIGAQLALPRDTQKTVGVVEPRLASVQFCFVGNDGGRLYPQMSVAKGRIIEEEGIKGIIAEAQTLARAVRLARFWTDLGPNQKTPGLFAAMVKAEYERACAHVPNKQHPRFGLEIMEEAELRSRGMGLILAVGGCHHEDNAVFESLRPRLVHFCVKADRPDGSPPIAFVLKGITFDSGGLQVKPPEAMAPMKSDMAAAALLALMEFLEGLMGLKCDVHIIAALAENMIGFGTMRPGDVYVSMIGKTVEIGHTDAEGRLVLADGISYSVKEGGALRVVSMATLTGAQMTALGTRAAVFANDDAFAVELVAAGLEVGELSQRMPLDPRDVPSNSSDVADLRNLPTRRDGGCITAALFLEEFVPKGVIWAHMDIAGPAWLDGESKFGHHNKGSTGFGALTIVEYVNRHCVAAD